MLSIEINNKIFYPTKEAHNRLVLSNEVLVDHLDEADFEFFQEWYDLIYDPKLGLGDKFKIHRKKIEFKQGRAIYGEYLGVYPIKITKDSVTLTYDEKKEEFDVIIGSEQHDIEWSEEKLRKIKEYIKAKRKSENP